jgi:hypothetical protein
MQKAERILFSQKIIMADLEIAAIQKSKESIIQQKQQDVVVDNANKSLMDPVNALIDIYHNELGRYTGIFRTSLTESIIQDAASLNTGNLLFPNDQNNTPPSILPKKVWIHTKPFALNVLIGKQLLETYPATDTNAEIPKINEALSVISGITSETLIKRVTGQHCVVLPGPVENIVTYPTMHTYLSDLVSKITHLQSYVNATIPAIHTGDTDPTRAAQASAAVADANNFLAQLNTWMSYPNFNTSHGQTTCAGFNSYNPALLGNTKLQSGPLTALQNALNNRLTFLSATRVSQINGYLGNLTQDMNTGELTSSTGFYGKRYQFLLLRLNRLGGSLFKVKGADTALSAQDGLISAALNNKNTYSTLLRVSPLTAPSNGTNAVVVKDSSGFSVGDSVYLVSNSQDELFAKITAIEPNSRLRLSIDIPPTYLPAEMARIYKVI